MKFSAHEDLNVPIDAIFARMIDAEAIARVAMRRGVQARRDGTGPEITEGEIWELDVPYRGKLRHLTAHVSEIARPDGMAVETKMRGLTAHTVLDLVALTPGKTRLALAVTVQPRTFKARLFVQMLKLTKGRLDRRFRARFSEAARGIAQQLAA